MIIVPPFLIFCVLFTPSILSTKTPFSLTSEQKENAIGRIRNNPAFKVDTIRQIHSDRPNLQEVFEILVERSYDLIKGPDHDRTEQIRVLETMRIPIRKDDDSMFVIVRDKAFIGHSLAFFYLKEVLFCVLFDDNGKPIESCIFTTQENILHGNREMRRLCLPFLGLQGLLSLTVVLKNLGSLTCHTNNDYGNNVGDHVIMAIAYASMGLQFCCIDVRVEGETIIFENEGCSISIQRQENVLHVTDNKTGVRSTFG